MNQVTSEEFAHPLASLCARVKPNRAAGKTFAFHQFSGLASEPFDLAQSICY
jgi:hypothetical protein